MEIVEGCQGAETLKLTYTPWRQGKADFYFPVPPEEYSNTEDGKYRLFTKEGAIDVKVRPDKTKDKWLLFGIAVSRVDYDNLRGDTYNFCGDRIYWVTEGIRGVDPEGLTVVKKPTLYELKYANGRVIQQDYTPITQESYNNRHNKPFVPERLNPLLPRVQRFYHYVPPEGFPDEAGCFRLDAQASKLESYAIYEDTLEFTEAVLQERTYDFYAVYPDGREVYIWSRTNPDVRVEVTEAYLDDPVEIEFTDLQGEYDFYLEEHPTHIELHKQFKFFDFTKHIASIASDPGLPIPEYEITCNLQGCPAGTCEVECGNTTCCYGADGVAVKSFEK